MQRFVGARGWGALTEHHLLVAIRDAILADPDATLHHNIGSAVACCVRSATSNEGSTQTGNCAGEQQQRLIALAIGDDGGASTPAHELDVYSLAAAVGTCAVDEASLARQSCLHLLLSPPAAGLNEMTAAGCWGDAGIVRCSLPSGLDCRNCVRTIVALQGHNNCGRLYGAAVALAQKKITMGSRGCKDINEQKKREKEKKEKVKNKKEKKEKQDRGKKSTQQDLTTRHSEDFGIKDVQRTAEKTAGAKEHKNPGSKREERKTKKKKKQKQREQMRCTDVTTNYNHGIDKQKKKEKQKKKKDQKKKTTKKAKREKCASSVD